MFQVEEEEINKLIKKEYNGAMKYGKFHSDHEFYAVLKEEADEVEEDFYKAISCIGMIWGEIKTDSDISLEVLNARKYAVHAIKELLQVCAVLDKWKSKEEE